MDNKKETSIYRLKYLVIPNFFFNDKSLSGLQIKVGAFIYSYSGEKFFFSNESLAEMFNVSVQAISNSIKGLEKKKYIKLDYKMRSNGGKIRFVTRLKDSFKSDYKYPLSSKLKKPLIPNISNLIDKDNNIKDNKKKGNKKKVLSSPKGNEKTLYEFSNKGQTKQFTLKEATEYLVKLWAKKFERNENQYKVTDKKKDLVRVRLKGFSVRQLAIAIWKASDDDWYGGRKSNWFASFDWILKNDEHVEKMLSLGVKRKPKEEDDGYEDLSNITKAG